jgi:phage N-6-adenine-methyltransferase
MTSQGRGIGGHHSHKTGTDEWMTPPEIIDALGPFDLDPSTPAVQPWPTAARRFTQADDGLAQEWPKDEFVFCNPPYSLIAPFMAKVAEHGNGIALVFARTETAWWFDSVWPRATGVLFLHGRLHFHHPDGARAKANAGGPSALIAYGSTAYARLTASGIPGAMVQPMRVLTKAPAVEVSPDQGALFAA